MKKINFLVFTAFVTIILIVPVIGFSEQNVSEGERLGKTCAGCHGTDGHTPGEYIGRIGGQDEAYMSKVLKEFRADKRPGSVEMSIIAKGYTDEQLEALASEYAGKKWVSTDSRTDMISAAAGKVLAAENGCMECHGANGEGSEGYPRVGGQNAGYLKEVLKRYRDGQIQSDEMSMTAEFSDQQIQQLADYMSSIR